MAKRKRTNSDLQSTAQNTKDRATRIRLKTRDEFMCSGMVSSSCATSNTRHVIVKRHEHCLTLGLCWTPVCTN